MCEKSAESELLLERLRDGDLDALAEEFSRHRQRLGQIVQFRLDRRMLGRVDVDDILQESYVEAARRVQHYVKDPSVSLFIWLRSIVNQTLIDVHRRHIGAQKRDAGREISLQAGPYADATSVSLAAGLLGSTTSPSGAAIRNEMSDQMASAIESMDETDREVLALRHFEELTNSEVAEILDIQPKAASIRYVRALRRLKGVLEGFPGFDDQTSAGN